jgi:hypothetical protein
MWAQQLGCVACIIEGERRNEDRRGTPPDVHHGLSSGQRVSHIHTAFLCPWHHRGVFTLDMPFPLKRMTDECGPSLHWSPSLFHARYGSDEALVARTDAEIAKMERTVV